MKADNKKIFRGTKHMVGHDLQWWLDNANRVYVAALVIIAVISFLIIRWQAEIQNQKDTDFEKYKISVAATVAQANENSAKANERAEKARLETVLLKTKLSWRVIEPEVAKELIAALSASPHTVLLAYTMNDPEGAYYTIQLSKIFSKAKWNVSTQSRSYEGVVGGLLIPAPDNAPTKLVRDVFAKAKIPFSTDSNLPPTTIKIGGGDGDVTVIIGSKIPDLN